MQAHVVIASFMAFYAILKIFYFIFKKKKLKNNNEKEK